jgi:ribonuclease BN (tRNA processing enzyme)
MLIHEVYAQKGLNQKSTVWKNYHALNHTSTRQLAELAAATQPKTIILYHVLFWGATEKELLEEISAIYDGEVIVGADLQVFC